MGLISEKSNIRDYIEWNGDNEFAGTKFTEVDAVLLCQIGYVHYDGLFDSLEDSKSFEQLSTIINSSKENYVKYMDIGVMNPDIPYIFLDSAKSERFKNVKLTHFISKNKTGDDIKHQEQFAAMTFLVDDSRLCVVFRGTDDSVVGWREDCNLALTDKIPAQQDALKYLKKVMEAFPKHEIFVAGHSKGGNLAMYACAHLESDAKKRLSAIYNFDGPGFTKETLESEDYLSIKPVLKSYYPHQSIVGMLFEHYPEFTVVKSSSFLIMQHELSSWQVKGNHFITEEELHPGSLYMNTVINEFLNNCDLELREEFIDAVFGILDQTNSDTIAQMIGNSQTDLLEAKMNMAEAKDTEDEARTEAVKATVMNLGAAVGNTFKNVSKTLGHVTVASAKLMANEETRKMLIEVAIKFTQAGSKDTIAKGKKALIKAEIETRKGYRKTGHLLGRFFEFLKSSQGPKFLLCLFFGFFGAHRFYIGNKIAGFTRLAVTLFGILTLWIPFFGFLILLGVFVWNTIDLIQIAKGRL